jgi:hypothetical protein
MVNYSRGAQDGSRLFPTLKSFIYKVKLRCTLQARANSVRPYKFSGCAAKLQFTIFQLMIRVIR